MKDIREIFVFLCTSAAKRRSNKQKARFVNFLTAEFANAQLPCRVEQKTESVKGLAKMAMRDSSTVNLIVGDTKKAKRILVAGYDTPVRAIFNIKYYPCSIAKNRSQEKKNLMIKNLIAFLLMAVCMIIIIYGWDFSPIVRVASILAAAAVNALGFEGLMRWSNFYNFNKNSGGVAVLWHMIDTIGVLEGQVAYVFCDQAANSYLGYRHLQEYLEAANPKAEVIILDCVSWGKELYAVGNSKAAAQLQRIRQSAEALEITPLALEDKGWEDTPMSIFRQAAMITCGEMSDGYLTVFGTRTSKDSNCSLEQLENLAETLMTYCQEQ